jgi:hypothetical protein
MKALSRSVYQILISLVSMEYGRHICGAYGPKILALQRALFHAQLPGPTYGAPCIPIVCGSLSHVQG